MAKANSSKSETNIPFLDLLNFGSYGFKPQYEVDEGIIYDIAAREI